MLESLLAAMPEMRGVYEAALPQLSHVGSAASSIATRVVASLRRVDLHNSLTTALNPFDPAGSIVRPATAAVVVFAVLLNLVCLLTCSFHPGVKNLRLSGILNAMWLVNLFYGLFYLAPLVAPLDLQYPLSETGMNWITLPEISLPEEEMPSVAQSHNAIVLMYVIASSWALCTLATSVSNQVLSMRSSASLGLPAALLYQGLLAGLLFVLSHEPSLSLWWNWIAAVILVVLNVYLAQRHYSVYSYVSESSAVKSMSNTLRLRRAKEMEMLKTKLLRFIYTNTFISICVVASTFGLAGSILSHAGLANLFALPVFHLFQNRLYFSKLFG